MYHGHLKQIDQLLASVGCNWKTVEPALLIGASKRCCKWCYESNTQPPYNPRWAFPYCCASLQFHLIIARHPVNFSFDNYSQGKTDGCYLTFRMERESGGRRCSTRRDRRYRDRCYSFSNLDRHLLVHHTSSVMNEWSQAGYCIPQYYWDCGVFFLQYPPLVSLVLSPFR